MSKEKVDAYRERKKNRKQELEKERRRRKMARAAWYGVGAAVVVGLCAAVGLTGWNSYKNYLNSLPSYDVTSQVIEDYAGVTTETEAEEAEEETEAGEETSAAAETEAVSGSEAATETPAAESAAE